MNEWIKMGEAGIYSYLLKADLHPVWSAQVKQFGDKTWFFLIIDVETKEISLGKGGFSSAKKAKDVAIQVVREKEEKFAKGIKYDDNCN